MKKIYDKKKIAASIAQSKYHAVLESMTVGFCLIKYEKGELVSSPFQREALFQIVAQGAVSIYFIRDDGTRYSLSNGTQDYLLGDMDIFYPKSGSIYVEAAERLTCISFSIEKNRELLLSDNGFLQLVCSSLSAKIGAMTTIDAASASLAERVMSYMKYKCDNGTLKGIEQAAFHLHCSARQLQRILNQSETDGLVKKTGKGTYRLTSACRFPKSDTLTD